MKKRDPNALYCDEPSLTQQAHAGDCDINEIMRRSQNGSPLPVSSRVPQYGDFTSVPSPHEAFTFVARATEAFMTLDWKVRERFANDPAKMIAFLNDSSNRDEAIKLGLVEPPPPCCRCSGDDASGGYTEGVIYGYV